MTAQSSLESYIKDNKPIQAVELENQTEEEASEARRILKEKFGIELPEGLARAEELTVASHKAMLKAVSEWVTKAADEYEEALYDKAADCYTIALKTARAALLFAAEGSEDYENTQACILDLLLHRATCVYQMRRYDLMHSDINEAWDMEDTLEKHPEQREKIRMLQNPGLKIPPKTKPVQENIWEAMDVIWREGEESEEEIVEQKEPEVQPKPKSEDSKQSKTKTKKSKSKRKGAAGASKAGSSTSAVGKSKTDGEEGSADKPKRRTNWVLLLVMLVTQVVGMFFMMKRMHEGKLNLSWFGL